MISERVPIIGFKDSESLLSDSCKSCTIYEEKVSSNHKALSNLKETHTLILEIAKALHPEIIISTDITSQELALDLNFLHTARGQASAKEAEHLRSLILGLNEKLKTYQTIETRLEEFSQQAKQGISAREIMHKTIKETLEDVEKIKIQQNENLEKMKKERDRAIESLMEMHLKLKQKIQDEEKVKCELEITKAELEKIKAEGRNFDNMQEMIAQLRLNVKEGEKKRNELRNLYSKSISDFEEKRREMDREIENVMQDNSNLREELNSAKKVINELTVLNEDKANQIINLKAVNESQNREILNLKDQENKALQMEKLSKAHQEECVALNKKIKAINEEFQAEIAKLNKEKNEILFKNQSLKGENNKLENNINSLKQDLSNSSNQNQDLNTHIAQLEESLILQHDSSAIQEQLNQVSQFTLEIHKQVYKELDGMSEHILAQSEQALGQQRTINKVCSIVSEKEAEIEILREMIAEMQKSRPVYVPVKDDPVDAAIAEYMNSREQPLEVPFVREDEGLYLFGSKKVFIKIENGKIIIRIGGGFMQIDEFVDSYTVVELEKFAAIKKAESNPNRKTFMGKLASTIVNEQTKGKVDVSPQKAAKILQDVFVNNKPAFTTCMAIPRKMTSSRQGTLVPKDSKGSDSPVRVAKRKSSLVDFRRSATNLK